MKCGHFKEVVPFGVSHLIYYDHLGKWLLLMVSHAKEFLLLHGMWSFKGGGRKKRFRFSVKHISIFSFIVYGR